jgi:hypothetical protein
LKAKVFKEINEINLPEISEVICSMIENDIENLHKVHINRQLQEKKQVCC